MSLTIPSTHPRSTSSFLLTPRFPSLCPPPRLLNLSYTPPPHPLMDSLSQVVTTPVSRSLFLPASGRLTPRLPTPPPCSIGFPLRHGLPSASLFSQDSKSMKSNADESGRMMLVNSNASYAAPLETSSGSSFMMRPLAEILRDLNKRVPDQVLKDRAGPGENQKYIPWYHANRMLSFYAPGWCGEVRNIAFSADGKFVTVIYRVTLRGSDGEAFREASGTICTTETKSEDPIQKAEEMAFCRACARFGLGLYLHHEEEAR